MTPHDAYIFTASICEYGLPQGSEVKNPPAVQKPQETQVQSWGLEDPLDEGMTTHFSILAWRIPWTEEPAGLQSMCVCARAKPLQQCPTLRDPMDCSLPGSFRQEYQKGLPYPHPEDLSNPEIKPMSLTSLALSGRFFTSSTTWETPGCSLEGREESDMTEMTQHTHMHLCIYQATWQREMKMAKGNEDSKWNQVANQLTFRQGDQLVLSS